MGVAIRYKNRLITAEAYHEIRNDEQIEEATLRVAFGRYIGEHEESDYFEGLYMEGTPAKFKPVWTKEHDQIVADYKNRKKEGKIKGFVVVPRSKTDIINT